MVLCKGISMAQTEIGRDVERILASVTRGVDGAYITLKNADWTPAAEVGRWLAHAIVAFLVFGIIVGIVHSVLDKRPKKLSRRERKRLETARQQEASWL